MLSVEPKLPAALPAIQSEVAASTGYWAEAIALLAGPARLRLSISDAKLATSDQSARERAASDLVATLQGAMESRAGFAAIQQIDIAIVHPAEAGGGMSDTHVEDLLQFRRAMNQRFVHHIT